MKKKIVTLIILIFQQDLFGITLNECANQGAEFSGKLETESLNPLCEPLTLETTTVTTRFLANDNTIEGHGHRTLIYFRKRDFTISPPSEVLFVIAGEQSKLETIHSIILDEENEFITVLANTPKVIFNFRLRGGNVTSVRTLKNDEINSVTAIFLNNSQNQIGLIHQEENKISFYNRFADFNGRTDEYATDLKGEIQGAYTQLNKPTSAVVVDDKLFVYNKGNQKLMAFALPAQGDQSPLQSWDISSLQEYNVIKIDHDPNSNKIIFFDSQQVVGHLPL